MYGPSEATNTETALLEPRRSLQNVGRKEKDDDDERNGRGNEQFMAFGADGFTFLDFLDIINPLQHIPLVSSLYRNVTGDEIDPASRVIGGTLFGGPVGTVAAMANLSIEQNTGKDMGEHVMAFFGGDDDSTDGAGDAPVLANAPGDPLSDTSEIAENIEVLNWARREAAFMGGGNVDEHASLGVQTAALTSNAAPGGVSDATTHALRASQRSGDIAGHMEVLEWARNEAAATRAAAQQADAAKTEEKGDIRHAKGAALQANMDRTTRNLARHDQLAGATAPSGGWFSETMLTAMSTYQKSAMLGRVDDPRSGLKAVNVSN